MLICFVVVTFAWCCGWVQRTVCSMRCLAKVEELLAVLNAFLCSWNRVTKLRPVCSTYNLLQSGHVSLYVHDRECITEICCLYINNFCNMLLVRNAIVMLVFLNMLVMNVVSLSMYVNVAHFCVGGVWVYCSSVL